MNKKIEKTNTKKLNEKKQKKVDLEKLATNHEKFLSPEIIIEYMDIANENSYILDIIFRMNHLQLEQNPKFSDKKDLSDVFNKFTVISYS